MRKEREEVGEQVTSVCVFEEGKEGGREREKGSKQATGVCLGRRNGVWKRWLFRVWCLFLFSVFLLFRESERKQEARACVSRVWQIGGVEWCASGLKTRRRRKKREKDEAE